MIRKAEERDLNRIMEIWREGGPGAAWKRNREPTAAKSDADQGFPGSSGLHPEYRCSTLLSESGLLCSVRAVGSGYQSTGTGDGLSWDGITEMVLA